MSNELSSNSILSHYRIVSRLGAGGMGEVWLAEDTRLGRKVALKLLPAEFTEDSERVRRFTLEAKAASALNHPNIIAVHDIGECETGRFIVMEFVAGRTLRAVIANDNSVETFFTLGAQMARALNAAHAAGITHRDIKPDNIMVRDDGYVKMLDFGLARLLPTTSSDPEAMTLAQQTTPGTVMGTLAYMSPEQATGQTIGSASDVFALGIVLYELATGSHPFRSETMIGYLHAITSQVPPSMTSLKSHLPVALDDLILRMLEKDPNQRPTAIEVAQALQEIEKYGSSKTLPLRIVAEKPKAKRGDEGFWIAVLPFKVRNEDPDVLVLADGLSEEIVTGLSRFRYLSVVTSASVARLSGETKSGRAQLDTRYLIEGGIRRAGSAIRVSVQLIDTENGAQLWSETYNQDLQTSTIFGVQDDLAARIVATAADSYGVLVHSMRDAILQKDDADLTPAEWQFQYFAYREQITPSNHVALKKRLERAAKSDSQPSDLWACLAQVYLDEYAFGFPGDDGTSLDRALVAARRAVELDRSNQFAMVALAQTHFFRQDLAAFGPAAERAMALNPLNTDALGILGLEIVHTGEFERGTAIVRRAMELNPNHAGWMHFAPLWDHFRKGEYEQALECANRVDVPGLFWPYLVMASACGHLGRRPEAEAAVKDLLALDPEFAAHARSNVESWHFASGLLDPILEGLRKAGLEISDAGPASTSSTPRLASVETRADEGFWVAVLPFKFTGSNTEVATLAEGLSEEIVTGLSRFSYLRVISRSSTLRYATESDDVRAVGKTLGARYVLEGSLRVAGESLRICVQLIDAINGAHIWAETYDRPFRSEGIFALQDELVPKIVSSVADMHGALPRSMSEIVRRRSADQLSPYEALLRSFGYNERFTPEELGEVRTCLERAVQEAPLNGDCWAMLSMMYANEYGHWHIHQPDSLDKALRAARTAVQAAPLHSLPYYALAQALFFHKEIHSFRVAAERAISLNPMDGATAAFMGLLIAYSGDWERGCALADKGLQLNPNHPGWYYYTAWHDAYRKQDYQTALNIALKLNAPDNFYTHAVLAMCYAQLGQMDAARKSLSDMLSLKPDYAIVARELHGKWIEPELVEQLMDGLRKAGLEISDSVDQSQSGPFVSSEARADEGFWVAVLPFKSSGRAKALKALAEGLSEDIVTGLSRFSYLHVIARGSTLRYANQPTDLRTVGKELGARYVMEGTLRQAGSKLRLAVQLVDATTGSHLWAENYEREFSSENIFELQDDLVPRIVSTVADWYGALPHSMSEIVRLKPPDQLSPYEALLRSFGYFENIAAQEHAIVRSSLERAVDQEPGNADLWAMLSMLFGEEHRFRFNVKPDSLERSLEAARKAVSIAHANHFAWGALAQALFFRKEFEPFQDAAERAIALNPMDGATVEYLGHLFAFSGDWERGCQLTERARQLNPNHPSWYWAVPFLNAYRNGDYRGARPFLMKGNPQKNWLIHALLASVNGQLGESEAAARNLQEVLTIMPDFPSVGRAEFSKWYLPELVDHLMDGLRKAGLEIPDEDSTSTLSVPSFPSSERRVAEGFWIAVLPFKSSGTAAELKALAEGLSEDIVTGLSRFSYLRVIARNSTLDYDGNSSEVKTIGQTLGARYVMEGSLRQSGTKLRLAVQLVDTTSGAHLWAETYDRPFKPDEIFALQDDLVPRIVSTVADQHGVLPHSMSEVLRAQDPDQLTAYETLLRGFRYYEGVTASEHATIRASLERALERSPGSADCWAMLSIMYCDEHKFGFNQLPDSLGRALNAAQRAVEISPTNPFAYEALSQALFFRKEFDSFRKAAERAIALNPMDGATNAFMGILIAFTGDWDYGCAVAERATKLNPHHPGWYWNAAFYNAYRKHDYEAALKITLEFNMPGLFYHHVNRAAVYGQLDDREAASKALDDLLALKPDFALAARRELGKWLRPEFVDHVIEGLRKAGLEIGEAGVAPTTSTSPAVSSVSRADEGFWVAVLPFKFTGSNTEVATLADGLSEEIVTGLSRFSYLRVISRSSTLRYTTETSDVRTLGKTLGARYMMEGSLRIAGSSLRISVQLIDAGTGVHLWAETYDRQFRAEDVFALQDDLVPRIVSTVADVNGVLPRSMSEVVCSKNPDELSPYEAVLRSFRYFDRVTGEELAAARSCLEIAVQKAPTNADAWAMLALLFAQDYGQGFNLHSDALSSATMSAQRAVEAGPSNHLAYFALAQARFFQKELQSFRNAAERAVALNPMDANSLAFMGELLTYVGDSDRGLALAARAKEINPNHPGWFWYTDFFHSYRQGDYRGALNFILKANLPGHWGMHAGIAAATAELGDHEAASKAIRDLLKIRPDFGTTVHRSLEKWFDPELCRRFIDGLRKAGLVTVTDDSPSASPGLELTSTPSSSSFLSRRSIVVLPFVNISNDVDNEYFCDGLAEELLNALSKIESLHVAARTSAFSFKGKESDIREIGSKLNVSTVLEGSVRKSGNRVRISVQLVNVADGYHLWSEKYDRELKDIFDIQDEISLAIVDALKVKLLAPEKKVVKRYTDNTEAYQLYLKGRFFVNRRTSESLQKAIECFNQAISLDSNYALGYAGLADAYMVLGVPDAVTEPLAPQASLTKARAAAEKALLIDDSVGEIYAALAHIKWKSRDWAGAERDYQRSIELKPNNPIAHFYYAVCLAGLGRREEAEKEIRRAQELDPLSLPVNASVVYVLYLCRKYDEAIQAGKKTLKLDSAFALTHQRLGLPYVQKKMYDEAINEFQQAVNSTNRAPQPLVSLGHAYAVSGNKVEAQRVLEELELLSKERYVSPYGIAAIFVGLGDNEQAFVLLERAFAEDNTELTFLKVDPRLDPMREDPRFSELLQRVGFTT